MNEPRYDKAFGEYCREIWDSNSSRILKEDKMPPHAFQDLAMAIGQLSLKAQELKKYSDVLRVSVARHGLLGAIHGAIRMSVSVGNVQEACEGIKRMLTHDYMKTLTELGLDQDVRGALTGMQNWLEENFAEENLPPEFQGQGLGIVTAQPQSQSAPEMPGF